MFERMKKKLNSQRIMMKKKKYKTGVMKEKLRVEKKMKTILK